MGIPVSPIIANYIMEYYEKNALNLTLKKLSM